MSNESITLQITGIKSPECANILTNLVIDERGVEKVEVMIDKNLLIIHGSFKLNKTQIIHSINVSEIYHAKEI